MLMRWVSTKPFINGFQRKMRKDNKGKSSTFDIIAGTSIGAIN